MSDYGDLGIMIRQLRTELEWAVRTGIVPPEVEPPSAKDEEEEERDAAPHRPAPELPPKRSPSDASGASEDMPPFDEEPPLEEPPLEEPAIEEPAPLFQRTSSPAPAAAAAPKSKGVVLSILDKCSSLEEVREVLGDCKRCKLGGLGRRQVVYGVGNPAADIMFVGEGPGADEDLQGEPFVGKAGQLLTKIIEAGMGMKRSDVYIANVVKCRPPQNRDPEPDEIETCRPFLEAQIRLVAPKVIVTLGRFAAQTLLSTTTGMMRLRGKWQDYNGIPVMPTFHPAYLLRNPADKRATWQDIQEVLRFIGRPVPKRG
jgi:DNA polymerase